MSGAIGGLCFLLALTGVLLWLSERRANLTAVAHIAQLRQDLRAAQTAHAATKRERDTALAQITTTGQNTAAVHTASIELAKTQGELAELRRSAVDLAKSWGTRYTGHGLHHQCATELRDLLAVSGTEASAR